MVAEFIKRLVDRRDDENKSLLYGLLQDNYTLKAKKNPTNIILQQEYRMQIL